MGIYVGYFDESSHEEDPYLVMGGIILDTARATDFEIEWSHYSTPVVFPMKIWHLPVGNPKNVMRGENE